MRAAITVVLFVSLPLWVWAEEPPAPRPPELPVGAPPGTAIQMPPTPEAPKKDTETPHEGDVVKPTDEQAKQKALVKFIRDRGLLNIGPGTNLCTDPHVARGYIVVGPRRKDLQQAVDVYEIADHIAKPLQRGLMVYLAKPEKEQGGIDMILEEPGRGVVIYRAFECKLKFQRTAKPAPKPKK